VLLLRCLAGRGPSSLNDFSQVFGTAGPGCLVGGLERDRDIPVGVQIGRHVRQCLADRDRLDVSDLWDTGEVGRQDERLVGRQLERRVLDLVPDYLVDSLGIAREGGNRSMMRWEWRMVMWLPRAVTICWTRAE
jgi:hypothetical protein